MNKFIPKKAKRTVSPRDAAYQRLMNAIKAIPGISPRDQLRKFTAFALKTCVLNQLAECEQGGPTPLMLWCDPTLLGQDVKGMEDWCMEAGLAYGGAVEVFEPFECILGRLFNEFVGAGKDSDCQHFTPWSLACGVVAFCPQDDGQRLREEAAMSDPTCGTGTLLLARLHQLAKGDATLLPAVKVFANDRDPLCSGITALQLMSNQLIWRMPVQHVVVECKDIISQYLESRPVFFSCVMSRFLTMSDEIRAEKTSPAAYGGVHE